MKYSSFYIKNFKGITELTLDLEKLPITSVTTLVGLNESGKTTILEALSFLENEIGYKKAHTLIPKSRKSDFDDTIEVHATIHLDEQDQEEIAEFCRSIDLRETDPITNFIVKIVYEFEDSVVKEEESGYAWEFSLNAIKKGHSTKRTYSRSSEEFEKVRQFIDDNFNPPIIYYPNFLFDFPLRIYLERYKDESGEQDTYRKVINDIIDTLGDGLDINRHIINRIRSKDPGIEEALEATIDNISARITQVVFEAWQELFDATGKEIKLKCGLDSEKGVCYLEVRLREGTNSYQIAERSLGFKWFFTFLLFTEFRKNRAGERGEILFLLDEPASNLHSTAQQKLLKTFENLASGCKLIYTTHSHHLINPKWLSGTYIVKNKALDYEQEFSFDVGKTDIEATVYKQFVVQHPEQRTYFQPVLDALEHQPGLLEEVPNIILTEGKNDYYAFKFVNEVILNGKYENLNFYPGNGADRNNQIIAMYLAWNREFAILLDGDRAGQEAKKRYIKEFGEIVTPCIVTLQDVDKSFSFATEGLFSEDEQLAITQEYDPKATSFNKSQFNTVLQQKLVSKEHTELDSVTIAKFEPAIPGLAILAEFCIVWPRRRRVVS